MKDKPYKDMNGLKRDIAKLWHEFTEYWLPDMKEPVKQWFKAFPNPFQIVHKTTNLWVEACRASPYFFGHVLMIWMVVDIVRGVL